MYFCGIDGGASNSNAVILDINGNELAYVQGSGIPLWLLPVNESVCRVKQLIDKAIQATGLPDVNLTTLGMCLSGSILEENNKKVLEALNKNYPTLSKSYTLKNDTFGPLKTGCSSGGMVLISGTGSNCQYIDQNDNASRCRGWGHLLGDEGSAFWIAMRAIKEVFDDLDHYKHSVFDCSLVCSAMLKYFNIQNQSMIMDQMYTSFEKSHVAGFCKILSQLALQDSDALCLKIFDQAGEYLAKNIIALLNEVPPETTELTVVCVGSVWKSWALLKKGFTSQLDYDRDKIKNETILIVELTKPSSIGAALMGAQKVGHLQNVDVSKNTKLLYELDCKQ